jgi:arylsulfatase A-like enzyme
MPKNKYANQRRNKITQSIDLMPTILDYNNVSIPDTVKGISIKELIEKDISKKKYALYGAFGLSVNIFDGKYTYFRGIRDNTKCYEYTTSPTTIRGFINQDNPETFEPGHYMKNNKFPVYKIKSINNPLTDNFEYLKDDMLFDLDNDYKQVNNIKDNKIENTMIKKLEEAMKDNDAPEEQYERIGLKETI